MIEGVVRSASGLFRRKLVLAVEPPGLGVAKTELYFDRRAADGNGWVAPFKLIKPANASYVLRLQPLTGWPYPVEPLERRVSASTSDLEFLVRDDVEHVDLDVLVVGARGEELQDARCDIGLPGVQPMNFSPAPHRELAPGQGPELRRIPAGLVLSWSASALGHRPARGEYEVQAGQEQVVIRLTPGWGTYLVELSRVEAPAGGEVWMDGRFVGPVDSSGVTLVVADAPPEHLRVWFRDQWAFDLSPGRVDAVQHLYSLSDDPPSRQSIARPGD